MPEKRYRRGDVFWVKFDPTIGAEINKTRPAVIVSHDVANDESPRVIVAPVTSSVKIVFPFEVKVKINDREGKVLLDQIKSIDKKRLGDRITSLNSQEMRLIDKALKTALALT